MGLMISTVVVEIGGWSDVDGCVAGCCCLFVVIVVAGLFRVNDGDRVVVVGGRVVG